MKEIMAKQAVDIIDDEGQVDNDLELRKKLSINSRKTIESKYNWNKRTKRIIEAIN